MRLLILNWRDRRHPKAGGAEIYTEEVARRWSAWGHEVCLFCAAFPDAPSEEVVDGVRIIRQGNQLSVRLAAFRWYRQGMFRDFDLVIDEINTLPFFTPLYWSGPKLMLMYQLAREIWWYEASFPGNVFGYLLEPFYLRLYQGLRTLTISSSTKDDLLGLGFRRDRIAVLPVGISTSPLSAVPAKEHRPTMLYVGRLARSKRVDHIVEAFALVRREVLGAQLWIVGRGEQRYERQLQDLVRRRGLEDDVHFYWFVSDERKWELLRRAHVLVAASVREGWGLTVIEANAMGTPAVAYAVHGLRDAIRHGETGLLCPPSPGDLANALCQFFANPLLMTELAEGALRWSRGFSWDACAQAAWQQVQAAMEEGKTAVSSRARG
ncbi:MAG: glycosyltransferase family 4 protein [Chloroflexi bacterium]|nr:glycosyltransferase family 4 protein [Chloroflexota bacterium]